MQSQIGCNGALVYREFFANHNGSDSSWLQMAWPTNMQFPQTSFEGLYQSNGTAGYDKWRVSPAAFSFHKHFPTIGRLSAIFFLTIHREPIIMSYHVLENGIGTFLQHEELSMTPILDMLTIYLSSKKMNTVDLSSDTCSDFFLQLAQSKVAVSVILEQPKLQYHNCVDIPGTRHSTWLMHLRGPRAEQPSNFWFSIVKRLKQLFFPGKTNFLSSGEIVLTAEDSRRYSQIVRHGDFFYISYLFKNGSKDYILSAVHFISKPGGVWINYLCTPNITTRNYGSNILDGISLRCKGFARFLLKCIQIYQVYSWLCY